MKLPRLATRIAALLGGLLLAPLLHAAAPDYIWTEGEAASQSDVARHPWWYDQVKTDQLSGGAFISHWNGERDGTASYDLDVKTPGDYRLWVRANSSQTTLRIKIGDAPEQPLATDSASDITNLAADGKIDLRFIGWIDGGRVTLKSGKQRVMFTFASANNHHGMLDAFVFVRGDFTPAGSTKPGAAPALSSTDEGWTAWSPALDPHKPSPIDLRPLNEAQAGQNGWIEIKDGRFYRPGDKTNVRFWAVNGAGAKSGEALNHAVRDLAKHGVNLIRIHGGVADSKTGQKINPEEISHVQELVAAAKREGIYTHLSIYFPLWFTPEADLSFLKGYDGKSHPFAALYFNPGFQQVYQNWWKALLTAPNPHGKPLIDEPALFGVELVNEDSFFFWTFNEQSLPREQLEMIETQFGRWAIARHGSIAGALKAWNNLALPRDSAEAGRLGFRPLYNLTTERTPRDQDTARFLAEVQRTFYEEQVKFLRGLRFRGLITASNWHTANDRILKPIEIHTYLAGDFIDRHGYFAVESKGEHVSWSVRAGHTYADRSALRFDPQTPGGPKSFGHPVADPKYNGRPSMISETTWNRPNRYRTEAPLFLAAYAALQGSDSLVHFCMDTARWDVKPGFFMQPWTLMSPSQMGQFPATALMYRQGLISEGAVMAQVGLPLKDVLALAGTPLVQEGNLDELRAADVTGARDTTGGAIDPRIHFVGRTAVTIADKVPPTTVKPLGEFIDPKSQTIRSQTGELSLDYGKGVLKITAPRAQALSGNLAAAGLTHLGVLSVQSPLEVGHVILVSLDGAPLKTSARMLLQVMTEERTTGWKSEPVGADRYRVLDLGTNPWRFRQPAGTVTLNRPDAASLKVTALDFNGYPLRELALATSPARLELAADVVYYFITRP
ncbi:MAG: hypothetical protein H7067_15685 [Burkholderiales bacterium]|nr:hypothetical protein [Opitutaceae bacterium]